MILVRNVNFNWMRCLQEEDILDMLAQCEADEKVGFTGSLTARSMPAGPKVTDRKRCYGHLAGKVVYNVVLILVPYVLVSCWKKLYVVYTCRDSQ